MNAAARVVMLVVAVATATSAFSVVSSLVAGNKARSCSTTAATTPDDERFSSPSCIIMNAVVNGGINAAADGADSSNDDTGRKNNNKKKKKAVSDDTKEAPPLRRNPPRKVCLMVEPTPFGHVSGYSNRFKEMLKYLKKAGDKVDILTVDSMTKPADRPKEFLGYPIRYTQGFTFPLYRQISLSMDLPEMKGAQIIEKFRPDLIHVSGPGFMTLPAIFYARVMCIPLLISYHTHLPVYGKNYLSFIPDIERISWNINRWVHSRADLTLVTSPQIKDEFVENGITSVSVWRKGIDTERFDPRFKNQEMRTKMTNGNPDDFLLVYVGRLGEEKRLKDIKPVLERLGPNTRLCLVGKGPHRDELETHFEGTNTVFTGLLSGDELSSAFASADAFIMPSDSETLGFVVLESMASGVPVVGCKAGGIIDLIDDENTGFLVEPGNTDKYVQRLQQLKDDAKLRQKMSRAARNEALKWGWEAATSILRNIQYERTLLNFHSRAFGGFGRPGTRSMWRLLGWRIRRIVRKFTPRFMRRGNNNHDGDILPEQLLQQQRQQTQPQV